MDRKFLNIRKSTKKTENFRSMNEAHIVGRIGAVIFFFIIQERDVTCIEYLMFSLIVLSWEIISRKWEPKRFSVF